MTAEELLQNTEDSELHEASNEVFVIDNDLRTIFVPESVSNIGVESDDDVNRLYFQMPKQYGEFDLSEFNIRINYMNADNKGDIYAVTDKEVSGDNITFSWLVGRTAFAKKGNVRFIVCLKKTDDEGSVQKEFNTTVATLAVLEGLETSEQIVQENPDIIEEILKRLDTLETTGGGGGGTPGKDGREIEIQNNGTAIQWRYVGDESWTDLVQLSDLKGQKGDPGDNGITPHIGENGNWYLGDEDTGKPSRGGKGDPGQTGATPNIQIGNVQTLEPGQDATASMTGTAENPMLNLGIPRGKDGESLTGGGETYELPIMSDTQLGGGKAVPKTNEDVPVAVDPSTGQLFVPIYPSGGKDGEWEEIADVTVEEDVISFTITQDKIGNNFNLKKVMVTGVFFPVGEKTEGNGGVNVKIDFTSTGLTGWNSRIGFSLTPSKKENKSSAMILAEITGGMFVILNKMYSYNESSIPLNLVYGNDYGRGVTINEEGVMDVPAVIDRVNISSYITTIGAGSRIRVWGVRA